MPEHCHLPQDCFDIWSMPLSETGISEAQIAQVGAWYAQHHKTVPSLPYITNASIILKKNGSLPEQRIIQSHETQALKLIQQAEKLGLSGHDCARALLFAGTLTHVATYRSSSKTDREDILGEALGVVRLSDYYADEILDDIEAGKSLPGVREYLLP